MTDAASPDTERDLLRNLAGLVKREAEFGVDAVVELTELPRDVVIRTATRLSVLCAPEEKAPFSIIRCSPVSSKGPFAVVDRDGAEVADGSLGEMQAVLDHIAAAFGYEPRSKRPVSLGKAMLMGVVAVAMAFWLGGAIQHRLPVQDGVPPFIAPRLLLPPTAPEDVLPGPYGEGAGIAKPADAGNVEASDPVVQRLKAVLDAIHHKRPVTPDMLVGLPQNVVDMVRRSYHPEAAKLPAPPVQAAAVDHNGVSTTLPPGESVTLEHPLPGGGDIHTPADMRDFGLTP